MKDPVASMEQAREDDPRLNAVRELVACWRRTLALGVAYTAADIAAKANEYPTGGGLDRLHPELHALLVAQCGTSRGDIITPNLGKWLVKVHGRVVDGHRIELVKEVAQGNRYALRAL
jgi:putative DNA primase/helicase